MGRPIKQKFFGNLNNEGFETVGATSGIGGNGIASIANPSNLGSVLVCSTATTVPQLVIPAPEIPTGVQATAQVVWEVESVYVTNGTAGHGYAITTGTTVLTGLGGGATFSITSVGSGQQEVQTIVPANRGSFTTIPVVADTYEVQGGDGNNQAHVKYRVKQINVTNTGSGYDSTLALSFNNTGIVGTGPSNPAFTFTVESVHGGAIEGLAYIPNGSSAVVYDIIKQEASRRYLVKTSQGVGQCHLASTSTLVAGQMSIIATDSLGSTYFVQKLTGRRAVLTRYTNGGTGFEYENNQSAGWSLNAATPGRVSIASA